MKIVFLDIDGVLNSFSEEPRKATYEKMKKRGWETFAEHWCPQKELTQRLLQITNALPDTHIVISSSWRTRSEDYSLWECLLYAAGGFDLPVRLCHESFVTPKLWVKRGLEIQQWLDEFPEKFKNWHASYSRTLTEVPIIDGFVILDDESDMEHLSDHLVQVYGEVGLTDINVKRAIEILKTPWERKIKMTLV